MSHIEEHKRFLREKIFSLYMLAAKSILTLASGTFAFNVTLQLLINSSREVKYKFLLPVGWIFLLVSILLAIWTIKKGIEIYYEFFNNLHAGKNELNKITEKMERELGYIALVGFGCFLIGVSSILKFVYINI